MAVLVTGGAGYIGSHTCVELLNAGNEIVILDNLSNSHEASLERIKRITGKTFTFYRADINDKAALIDIFQTEAIDAVIHFAGLKAVGESVSQPLRYYQNNVQGTLTLLDVMQRFDVFRLVFSSSATVYGDPESVPIKEDFPLRATNPYGQSKLMVEQILQDLPAADARWSVILLRYFNPVGAHPSGLIGEDPLGLPNNLMPFISQVAIGKLERLKVFGDDYPTPDGTGVRDYIHVVDLSKGHLKALQKLHSQTGVMPVNLGTGRGYSVLEMIKAFEKTINRAIDYEIVARRPGDIATCYADPSFSTDYLGWKAELGIDEMTRDAWRWQCENPQGYINS